MRHRSVGATTKYRVRMTFDEMSSVEDDAWDLQRFIDAQDKDGTFDRALDELRAVKTTHWIWFVFPQVKGLTQNPSERTAFFSLRGKDEALAYASHPVLSVRLAQACDALRENSRSLREVLPTEVDRLKLQSSMTLFAAVAPEPAIFEEVLRRYFDGERDERTVAMVAQAP